MPKAPEPKEIREMFSDFTSDWRENREEAKTDMRFVAGDPWEPEDRKARDDAGRPCISPDELNQYLNQAINNVRQNKRAIKVTPRGAGANDKDAEHRAAIIRGIEYRSKAQSAYITAFENALQRGYGYARLMTVYSGGSVLDEDVTPGSFDKEIVIRRIPNPDTVLHDSDYREADASDISAAFLTELIPKKKFKEHFPKAKIQSFTGEQMVEAKDWVRDKYIQVAGLWVRHSLKRKLNLLESPEGPVAVYAEDTPKGMPVLESREVQGWKVIQYVTNGLEILEENEWAGSWIPILACFGKELFLDDGGGAKRVLMSMVRLARDPQMMLAYLASQEAEEAGMAPRSPFVGYKGQFESDGDAWENLSKIARAYVQVDPVVDAATGQVLPFPQRPAFIPNFATYEVAKEAYRRAIQASMGISPLPTSAQRNNEKSGVALQRIATAESVGAFHFTDNFDRFLENGGRQINELIGPILDSRRVVPTVDVQGQHGTLRVNDPQFAAGNPQEDHLDTAAGQYDVTIATGPSYDSQREAASDFVDLLVGNLKNLPVPPPVMAKLLSLSIKLKAIGPIGDEMASVISPSPDDQEQQMQSQMAQLQQQNQQLMMMGQKLSQEYQKLQAEKQGKVVEGEYKLALEKLKIEAQVAVAEITTKAQQASERLKLEQDIWIQTHQGAHEAAMQATDHSQQATMAAQAAPPQQEQQAATEQVQPQ